MATQYPLHHKAFTWLLSVHYLLSYIPYSALPNRAKHCLDDDANKLNNSESNETIKSHYKTLNMLPCNPHGYWIAEH